MHWWCIARVISVYCLCTVCVVSLIFPPNFQFPPKYYSTLSIHVHQSQILHFRPGKTRPHLTSPHLIPFSIPSTLCTPLLLASSSTASLLWIIIWVLSTHPETHSFATSHPSHLCLLLSVNNNLHLSQWKRTEEREIKIKNPRTREKGKIEKTKKKVITRIRDIFDLVWILGE